MKFSCSRDELLNAVNITSKGAAPRSPIDVLQGILFSLQDGKLHLTSTDQEIGVKTAIPADSEDEGEIVINASMIGEIIKRLAGDEVFFETDEKNRIKVKSLLSEFTLNGMSAEEYPDFPEIDEEYSFEVSSKDLKDMIRATKDSIAVSENIPVLTGVKLEVNGNQIRMVSLDGYRLALSQSLLDEAVKDECSVVIPGNSLKELIKLLSDTDEKVKIEFSPSQIFFEMDGAVFTSRLLEGEFINYADIIPKESTTDVTVDKNDLFASCDRASLLAKSGKNNLIKMEFNTDELIITSNEDGESVNETVKIRNTGAPLKIAFNSKFFMDALRVIDDEDIRISLTTPFGPALINPEEGNDFTFMILPVRIAE